MWIFFVWQTFANSWCHKLLNFHAMKTQTQCSLGSHVNIPHAQFYLCTTLTKYLWLYVITNSWKLIPHWKHSSMEWRFKLSDHNTVVRLKIPPGRFGPWTFIRWNEGYKNRLLYRWILLFFLHRTTSFIPADGGPCTEMWATTSRNENR